MVQFSTVGLRAQYESASVSSEDIKEWIAGVGANNMRQILAILFGRDTVEIHVGDWLREDDLVHFSAEIGELWWRMEHKKTAQWIRALPLVQFIDAINHLNRYLRTGGVPYKVWYFCPVGEYRKAKKDPPDRIACLIGIVDTRKPLA